MKENAFTKKMLKTIIKTSPRLKKQIKINKKVYEEYELRSHRRQNWTYAKINPTSNLKGVNSNHSVVHFIPTRLSKIQVQ